MTALLVGVDGGGTRCRVLVIDLDGGTRGRAEGPGAAVDAGDPARAAVVVAETVRGALADAGGPGGLRGGGGSGSPPVVAALWAGLAGAGREEVRAAVERELVRRLAAGDAPEVARLQVGTDARAAFQDAFGPDPGILLVAGTGSMALGRDGAGRWHRTGGWGPVLGDEGSGYAIGRSALRRVARSADGRGKATVLLDRVLGALALPGPEALIPWAAGVPRAEVAALAPLVATAADDGDGVARDILARSTGALVRHVDALARRTEAWPSPLPVALAGGLLGPSGPLAVRVRAALNDRAGGASLDVAAGPVDPVRGAVALARELLEGG